MFQAGRFKSEEKRISKAQNKSSSLVKINFFLMINTKNFSEIESNCFRIFQGL